MRLIDADELVRNILSQTIMNETDAKIMDRYLYCINNQSTAYDIDKVVEEIESNSYYRLFEQKAFLQDDDIVIDTDRAIEIVKAGE